MGLAFFRLFKGKPKGKYKGQLLVGKFSTEFSYSTCLQHLFYDFLCESLPDLPDLPKSLPNLAGGHGSYKPPGPS